MESLRKKLADFGQEHLLKFWDELSEAERSELSRDISVLDLAEVTSYFKRALQTSTQVGKLLDKKLSPIPKENIASEKTLDEKQRNLYEKLGLQEIADGKIAVVLMAGGQGTRLGVSYPKGMYNVSLPSGKTLFQLQAERILRLQNMAEKKCGKKGNIVWYILTSEATHDPTVNYLRKHNYFNLKEKNVKAFKQGMLPCFSFDGKIILDQKHRVAKAPDGNGGLYRALSVEGILDDMVKRGIRSVHVHSVDNILIKVADPIFIGYCLSTSSDCGVKVVEKSSPNEPVGVVCRVDNVYQVVEYSEITKETSELRSGDGQLMYNAANMCNHYFTVDFLRDVSKNHEHELDLHVAKKKIPFVDNEGNRIEPKSPNGFKIEKFVFDVFKFAKHFTVLQGSREEDFSPLKNSDEVGQDCPYTARRDVLNLHKKWLSSAGATVKGKVEVSPLVSYAGEDLEHVKGQTFEGPYVLEQ